MYINCIKNLLTCVNLKNRFIYAPKLDARLWWNFTYVTLLLRRCNHLYTLFILSVLTSGLEYTLVNISLCSSEKRFGRNGGYLLSTHYVTCSMCLNSLIRWQLTVEVTIKCAPCLLCCIGDDCQICSTLHSHRQQIDIMWIQTPPPF